jgi:hypothetical protein
MSVVRRKEEERRGKKRKEAAIDGAALSDMIFADRATGPPA